MSCFDVSVHCHIHTNGLLQFVIVLDSSSSSARLSLVGYSVLEHQSGNLILRCTSNPLFWLEQVTNLLQITPVLEFQCVCSAFPFLSQFACHG